MRVEFLVTDEEHARLAKMAADERKPIAAVIREAVNEFVSDYSDVRVF